MAGTIQTVLVAVAVVAKRLNNAPSILLIVAGIALAVVDCSGAEARREFQHLSDNRRCFLHATGQGSLSFLAKPYRRSVDRLEKGNAPSVTLADAWVFAECKGRPDSYP
jgi:hypothetical protein